MNLNINIYETPEKLAEELADQMMNWIGNHPEPVFHLAVSGGKTPELLFKALSEKYTESALWNKVHFWWVDERMVPPDDPESNFGMVNRILFRQIPIPGENIHRIKGENNPSTEALDYSHQIQHQLTIQDGWPIFSLILLGMGEDGHTASIFPDQMHLLESDKICEVASHPQSGQKRLTFTAQTINHALKVCFLITGSNKAERLMEILTNHENAKLLPASHIHPLNNDLNWYLDEEAAHNFRNKIPI